MRFRSLVLSCACFVGIVASCAVTDESAGPSAGSGADAAADTAAHKADGAVDAGDVVDSTAPGSDATVKDGSVTDSSVKADASDATATDANASDAKTDAADASTDAKADAKTDASADAGADGSTCAGTTVDPTCVPAGGNFALCGVATATSEYSSSYAATFVNDGTVATSWYADTGACPSSICPTSIYVEIELNTPRTVGRVKFFGNTDFNGYDVLTARVQLLDGNGTVVYTADVTASRGAEPNGNVDHAFTAVPCVKKVRVIPLTMESGQTGPGLAEIEAYAN